MMNAQKALLIGGVLVAACLVLFAMCGGFLYFGLQDLERQIEVAIEQNPVVQQRIGTDVDATYDEPQSLQLDGFNEYCYQIRGPKGEGTVYADFVTIDAYEEAIGYGVLTVSTGESYDLNSGEEIDVDSINTTLADLSEATSVSD